MVEANLKATVEGETEQTLLKRVRKGQVRDDCLTWLQVCVSRASLCGREKVLVAQLDTFGVSSCATCVADNIDVVCLWLCARATRISSANFDDISKSAECSTMTFCLGLQ